MNDDIFIHDGWQVVMSLKNDVVAQRYLWGAKQDELLCKNNEWALGDHLNTVRDVVKSDGSVAKHLEYNAFGELLSEPTDELSFAYTGKLFDNETRLQCNINRWYDAKVGRWVNEDPVGFEGKDVNLSRYVHNNPFIHTDSSGLFAVGAYGLFCGPARAASCVPSVPGNLWSSHVPSMWNLPPIDSMDAACMNHDCCLATWRQFLNPCNVYSCNQALCNMVGFAAGFLGTTCHDAPDVAECVMFAAQLRLACLALGNIP